MDIIGLTDKEDELFTIENDAVESRTTSPNARLEYEIFYSRDITKIERSVYNLFMLLGDIGGF